MTIHPTLRAANVARQAEWDPNDKITLSYRLNELAGETGEACNVGKKLERERLGIPGSRATVIDLADELADVIICADLVAMAEGIDLDAAVTSKFNATSEKIGLQTRLTTGWRFDMGEAPLLEPLIVWWPQLALDDDGERTDQIVGGNQFITNRLGEDHWNGVAEMEASGSYFDDDWEYADAPTAWMPLGPDPAIAPTNEEAA